MRLLLVIAAAVLFLSFTPGKLPDKRVPNSFGMQTKDNNCSAKDLRAISDLGARYIRKGVYWKRVEQEKGVYDFSWYDRLMEDAEENGLYVLGTLYGSNELYEDDGLGGIQTEEGRQGFAAFAAALAEHYKDHNILWEIWNEPNTRTFWNKDGMHNSDEFADEYTALVKAVTKAMLEKDPDCFVMAGSVSAFWEPSYNWINACFKKGIGESGIRAWSVHPYGLTTPEEYAIGYRIIRGIFKDNGIPVDFPIINSERGFSLEKLHEGWSGGDASKAEDYQAWHIVRQYLADLMNDIHVSIWYEWDADKFGIVNGKEKRPSFYACKNMIDELTGYSFKKRLEMSSSKDYLVLFENDWGKQKLVAWTAPGAGETPDKYEGHTVEIPLDVSNKITACDVYGNKTSLKVQRNRVQLELTGAPVYISLP